MYFPTVSLQDIHMRKAFKSSIVYDQAVVSRSTMPAAMAEMYRNCGKPPPLDKLNPYRFEFLFKFVCSLYCFKPDCEKCNNLLYDIGLNIMFCFLL